MFLMIVLQMRVTLNTSLFGLYLEIDLAHKILVNLNDLMCLLSGSVCVLQMVLDLMLCNTLL